VVAHRRKSDGGRGLPVLGAIKTTSGEEVEGPTCSWVAVVARKRGKVTGRLVPPFKPKQAGEMGGGRGPAVATWWEKGGMVTWRRRWGTGSRRHASVVEAGGRHGGTRTGDSTGGPV
jgi:hypothetical protein